MMNLTFVSGLVLLCALAVAGAEKKFPEWRGGNAEVYGLWERAPIVAVGDVTNIRKYGEQKVGRHAWPMPPWARKLYWRQGDFQVAAVIKGNLQLPPKKFLWAQGPGDCKLWSGNRESLDRLRTRAWFLREEGEFLRPLIDSGVHFFGLFPKFDDGPRLPARERLGALLLVPWANSGSLGEYANYLEGNAAYIACDLLGKTDCAQRIRAFEKLGDADLKRAACSVLTGMGENCSLY